MKNIKFLFIAIMAMLFFVACSDENTTPPDGNEKTAKLSLNFTDAPIDNAEVEACFVTVSEVYLDGDKIEGFSNVTVDLLAYQNGDVYFLGDYDVDAKSYTSIDLKLQAESDDTNTHPFGCYIMDADGKAHALLESDIIVKLDSDIKAEENSKTELVLDFDLRKCIQQKEGSEDNYDFVAQAKLNAGIRVASKNNSHIVGECSALIEPSDEKIVYVYKKGEFNAETETMADVQTGLQFNKAVSSAKVDANNKFELNFLQEGEYELHFYGYDKDGEGNLQLKGKLEVQLLTSLLNLTSLSFNSETNLELEILILGIG